MNSATVQYRANKAEAWGGDQAQAHWASDPRVIFLDISYYNRIICMKLHAKL